MVFANALKTLNSVNAPKIPKTPEMTVQYYVHMMLFDMMLQTCLFLS